MSGGFTPSVHLYSQSRGKLHWNEALQAFIPGQSAECERSAGACRGGRATLLWRWADGAAGRGRRRAAAVSGRARTHAAAGRRRCSGARRESLRGLAERCHHARSAARRTRRIPVDRARQALHHDGNGDRPGQDMNLNALAIVAAGLNVPIPQVGLTTFRMPYTPVTFGSLAGISRGDLFIRSAPRRLTSGRARRERCSYVGRGSAPAIFRAAARTCTPRWRASAAPCATPAASSMPLPWGRSRSSARMRPSS